MADLRVNVWTSRTVTWVALTQDGALQMLLVGPRTNDTLREAALLAKGTGARFFREDYEECPQAILNLIGQE